jgi:hypothetical protein
MPVQPGALQPEFHNIMMGMDFIFRAPVSSSQKMVCNKVAFNGYGIHHNLLILDFGIWIAD